MNRIFRIIWSRALRAWVVASELAVRRGKSAGGVDKRAALPAFSLDSHAAEGMPPATAWPRRLGILLALLSLYAPVRATTFNWDANGTAVGLGGTGTWDITSPLWSPNTDGVSGPFSPWSNAALNDAVFGGTAGTVTLGVPITVHNLTFAASGYTLTGNTLTLGGATPTITTNAGVNATINSVIAGSAGLTKAGTGGLFLNGVNTFTGTVNVTSGGLNVNADAALGAASNGITLANGTGLLSTGALAATRTVTLTSGAATIYGGAGSARYTGAGGVNTAAGVNMSNDANNYTGQTFFANGSGAHSFTSIADLGVASSLGAPTTAANGSISVVSGGFFTTANYIGDGDSSNRNWAFTSNTGLVNSGTGTLTLTGNFANLPYASASTADLNLLGVMSGAVGATFTGGVGRTITLGTANTYSGGTTILNATVRAGSLTNAGSASSLGTGSSIAFGNGVLSYTGAGNSSDRTWSINGAATLNNDGSGALALSGAVTFNAAAPADIFTLGGSFTGVNTLSGVISGAGGMTGNGSGTWVLGGANTYTGTTTVNSGVLRAGTAQAFGASTNSAIVNGGTLDLNGFGMGFTTLAGTGGTVALGAGDLTLNAGSGVSTSYGGSITGSGGLTKLGGSTQTLTGASTYTGATTIGGGALSLNFAAAGGPTSNIISGASTLNMSGGLLTVTGAAGETNSQTFNGLNVTAGSNTITATSGTGGSMTVNLGAINRTGGLVNFGLPGSGNITTTNTTLGGWATVNGTNYAKVVGGNIVAFTAADYVNKDDASTWLNNDIISDAGGSANTPYFGTVSGSKQIGGLQYTAAANSTVTVGAGNTLGVDGTIIVSPSVGAATQTITGGSLTGTLGGGVLGIQQNGTGTFTIASQIVDNGGSIGFTKAGTGLVTLTSATSNYTGGTIVSGGILAVSSIANGGAASSIGASSAAASNLVRQDTTLRYTGGTTSSDRGFTLAKAGVNLGGTIDVSNAASNLTLGGVVTSADGSNFTKTGAGTLTLTNAGSDYVGTTTVSGGTLGVSTLANGGLVSSIGASSSASSNLILNGGTLMYNGGTASTDRGFTVGTIGAGGLSGGVGVSNAATTLTMSGTVIGDDGFRKEGAGTLVLSGTNTYTGGTTVNAGTLRAGSTQAFGINNNLQVQAGALVDLNNFNNTIGWLGGSGNVTLGSATLTTTGTNTFSGSISGTGGFTSAAGTQTMSGCNNTYLGVTSLSGGAITTDCLANGGSVSGIGMSTSAASNVLFNNGYLNYTGGTVSIDRGLTMQSGFGVLDVTNAATTLGISGSIVGGGTLYARGPGTLVLSGNNTYSGGTVVDTVGILRAGSTTAFGTGGLQTANIAGATIDLNNFSTTVGWLNGGGALGGNITLGSATLTLNWPGSAASYAGAISGTGGLVKMGALSQTLSGCNSSYTGTTTISAGVLATDCLVNGGTNSAIGASSAAAGNLTLSGGATLRYIGAATSSDRLFTLGAGGGALDASGTGALNLTNTGLIAQTGANSTLTLTGTNTGTNILSAQLNNGVGTSALTKTGTGTWRLTNNSSAYTGVTTISGGVLEVSQLANGGVASGIGASSNAASNLIIGSGATLRYTGAGDSSDRQFTLGTGVSFIESSGTGAINFTNIGAVTLQGTNTARTIALGGTNTGNNTFAGSIGNNGTGVTTLAKNDSGNWMLTGNNTYTGNTVVNDGNLMIGNGGTSGNLGTGNVIVNSPTSTLSMNRSDTVIFNATMSGPGTFAQVGTGTTTLTANNSIGATTVSAGTLDVNGVLNTGTIAMSGTSTLNVDGTVQAPGGTAAVLTGDGGNSTINVNSGATLRANGDLGDGSDALHVTGTLDTGAATLSLGAGNDTLTLNDGAVITGPGVDGGAGSNDNLVVNNALALTFGGTGISGFEQLTKNNTGTLTLTNSQSYSAGTAINGGTLDVAGTLQTPTVSMADSTTLNVDGTLQGIGGTVATLTGSAGSNTINVNSGATLRANGDLGNGVDNLTLSGALDTGAAALSLGAGDETVTLHDGAAISGVGIDAGIGIDTLVLDNALALSFDGSQTAGFETLLKQNTGTAIMTGTQSFSAGTTIAGGTLAVAGALQTPTIAMADGTALTVGGSLQAAGGTAAVVTGSAGTNTVTVGAGGTLLANGDLGTGNDVLDVAGTLNTGTGVFALGGGDDTLTIHDNTQIIGTVSAGAGNDTLNTDIATVADLGAVQGFETLSKTGAGVLNINGPLSSDFNTVNVLAGTLDVAAGGSVVGSPGIPLTTTVASGATLKVDGSYGCSASDDTMTVSGTVSGSGTIDLCGGNDTLTLNDGAVLNATVSGGPNGAGDTVVLNNANALTFDASKTTNFEFLTKNNTGVATLTGTQSFSGGTTINAGTLTVTGALTTPTVAMADNTTLNVGGSLQAGVGTAATLTGSAGVNTVTVGAGGTLLANGDLGDGNDVVDVSGTLDTGAGVLALGLGNDSLTIHDGTSIVGTVNAGAGTDTLNADIATSANLGAVQSFETLSKTGVGVLNVNGPASSDFGTVNVLAGTLNVAAAGAITAQATTVAAGSTLQVDGSYSGTAGSDTLTVAGTVTGTGTLALLGGDDTFTIQDGADTSGLTQAIDGGTGTDTFVADIAGTATLGGAINFETLTKTNTGTLHVDGPAASAFTTVNVGGGTLDIGAAGSIDGAVTTTVASGATLNVDGSYTGSSGNDTMIVSGTVSGSGTIGLGAGDDTLTLNDGAVLTNVIDGGPNGPGDTVVLNNANALTFDASKTINFEFLTKNNTGEATLTGTQSFSGGTTINAGTLTVTGALTTPTVAMADDTTLNVDGSLQAAGGTAATLTGSAGVNTVTVGAGGTLLAAGDLGAGSDVLDVSGTLDTLGGTFALGDGDDTFTVHDGTVVNGTVDGGAGFDTRVYDINTTPNLGALVNFEGVTKTGTGVLNINGPGATDLQQVDVLGGTLNVAAGASVVATAGSALNTVIASGATLNVDGSYGCGASNDTMSVSGTVSGSGTIDLCGGDDTLILNDGAVLNATISGGPNGPGDTVVLNNANALTFDASKTTNFEFLTKNNTGEATLTGTQSFSGGTALNAGTLTVAGTLDTPTVAMGDNTVLNVNGLLEASGGTDAVITGSAGANTVNVASGALLIASGDLGAGDDVLNVAGTLNTGGNTLSLGDGSDTFTIHDGTVVQGTVDGGAGLDTFNPDINTSADLGALTNFEVLTKTGVGVLNVNGPGQSNFAQVNVLAGTLNVGAAGGIGGVQNATVASGATLNLAGGLQFTSGDDTLTVAGTVTGGGTLDLGDGNDTFILQDGANLSGLATPVNGGAGTDTLVADLAGSAVLGGAVNFETLTKTNVGTLNIAGPAPSVFTTVNVNGGTLNIGAAGSLTGVQAATVASGANLVVDGGMQFTPGADSFLVAGNVSGLGTIDMLDGNDTLTLQDGADLSGLAHAIDGGAGTDTVVADIAGNATLGGATNFETLTKTNTGTLNIAGPAPSDFTTVNVDGGTLNIGAAGSISGAVSTTVAAGATLNVDGSYAGSAGDDTMTVAGTVSGSGTIGLGAGDDTLTLNDGAVLANVIDGGPNGPGDTVVLNNANALTFDAGKTTNFEFLTKNNSGVATLTGTQSFSGGTTLNGGTLTVAGTLTTPTAMLADDTTLNVDGTLQAAGGTAAAITGSAGVNTVTVGAGGTLLATGDLGAGNDVLDVTGTLDTQGGVFALGDGNDNFVVHDGTVVNGTVDGGAGLDTRTYDINQTADLGALVNFEGVTKTGTGVLNINGPVATDLQEVQVLGGTLNIAAGASVVAIAGSPLNTVVASGASLQVNGSYGCGASNDTMTVAGTVSGSGTIDMCGGDDVLTLQDGAVLDATISGGGHVNGDTVVLDNANALSFDASHTINFEYLRKDNAGVATLTGAQSFVGGTTLNGGTLNVAGQLETPTVAMADNTVFQVNGTVQAAGGTSVALSGSAGTNTVTVGAGGTLRAAGDLGDGNDVLDVAGTLDTGAGSMLLGAGDDTLTIHDNTHIIGTVSAGAGNDTFNADIAGHADLGAVQQFETLSKTGAGVLDVNGPASSDFTTVNVLAGTLNVAAGGSIAAQATTVAANATLQVAGSYTGTSGDDSFVSRGTVIGALAFGAGNDSVDFIGGNMSGVTALDGGAGTDRLGFSGQTLDGGTLPTLTGWERVELLNGSALTLGKALDLSGGVLAIDGTSQLLAHAGAAIQGDVENAGLIDAGANRLAIHGNYTSNNGALQLTVSPSTLSTGGLDIDGDVRGTTRIAFNSNGSEVVGAGKASILVISSPHDDPGTSGGFVPASTVNGAVRLNGSLLPWTFEQEADHNWYLNAQAGLLPEIPAYGVLPTLATMMARQDDDLVHQRLTGIRGTERPACGHQPDPQAEDAGTSLVDDCHGVWVATTGSSTDLGANPGFAASGSDVGLYAGADYAAESDGQMVRIGAYVGYLHGNYWTTGANSTGLHSTGAAGIRLDTPLGGGYGSLHWTNGAYVDLVVSGQNPHARVRTVDGFTESLTGNGVTVSARTGKRFTLDSGWTLEPHLQLTASKVEWNDKVDTNGRELTFANNWVDAARAGVRMEKTFITDSGATIKPWVTLAVEDTFGQSKNGLQVAEPGAGGNVLALPNQDLGTTARIDAGVEAKLNPRVSVFGVLSASHSLHGSDFRERAANVGVRVRW
jgi:fibronectin-binding autotransporter adhesin